MSKNYLVVVPGLSDCVTLVEKHIAAKFPSFVTHIYRAPWKSNKESYSLKMKRFLEFIDKLVQNNNQISLIGISAGGSFVLNAYMQRKSKIKKVVNVCGRLRSGKWAFPPLSLAAIKSKAFCDSVRVLEQNEVNLTALDRKKLMTMSGWFDELVPHQLSILEGAENLRVPTVGHIFSQAYALMRMNKKIINFIAK